MTKTCSVCGHSKREAIDSALIVGGTSLRKLAKAFAVSTSALCRHRRKCIPELLAAAKGAAAQSMGEGLLEQVAQLQLTVAKVIQRAEIDGTPGIVLAAVGRSERLLELRAKLTGELKPAQVNVLNVPIFDETTLERMARFFLDSQEGEQP